jgi:hypothetical protein
MMAKKTNPRTMVPLIQLDRERKKIRDEAVKYAFVVIFSVMNDKHGWGKKRLKRLYQQIDYVADSIVKGYVKLDDMARDLEDRLEIHFVE